MSALRFGVIGHPIAHSRSPAMHAAALAQLGVDATYEAWDVAPEALAAWVRDFDGDGFNVTFPHKETILPLLASLDAHAAAIGAVNTVTRTPDGLVGTNTDARGLVRALDEAGFVPSHRSVLVLGAGGAARATVMAVVKLKARRVVIVARNAERASRLIADLAPRVGPRVLSAVPWSVPIVPSGTTVGDLALIVNATPATLRAGPEADATVAALPWGAIADDACVLDLGYTTGETALVRAARSRGLRASDGLGMLVHQGALSLERWLGRMPSLAVMRAALA